MIRLLPRVLVLGLYCAASTISLAARADSSIGFLADQLKNASDFRVRTQAALALGSSEEGSAVTPLCEGLDDPNDTVRSASAAALAKLKNSSGIRCLQSHLTDTSPSVRSVVERSVKALQGAGGKASKPPLPGPNDTFYVAIGPVTDKTGRGDKTVGDLVASAMQEKILSLRGYAVAPSGESSAAAKRIIKQKGLKGFFLQTRVEEPPSADLTVQVRVTMWSYPGKALQGEFSPKLTMAGASAGDKESEDNLIKMAVERAIESFARVAASTD
jgi:hypothetical protein